MKLSIIIPAYNVEKYLAKCLETCLNQDVSKDSYEIIVVIDGSPDNSLEIAQSYANKYNNISIINQENQGLSMARNNGLRQALGEYVWFIDSDDWIETNCLKRICSHLINSLDILQIQYRYVFSDSIQLKDGNLTIINGIKTGKEVTINGGLPAPVPFSIYRKNFLIKHRLCFQKGIYHEDSEFKPRATYLANRITSDNEISYNYLQRTSGSITSNFKLKNGLDIIFVMNSLLNFTNQHKMTLLEKKAFYQQIGLAMNTLLLGYRELVTGDKKRLIKELSKQTHLFKSMSKSGKKKYIIEGLVFSLNTSLGFYLHKIFRK